MANLKRPLCFVNRTNYFSPESCRTHVRFSSPNTYLFRQSKIEGYETRLYWQYRYCEDNGYPVYYYTLTYNDRSLPDFFGVPCFDYEDLREFFRGGFHKQLIRKYGVAFRYFVGAELGEGAGNRGFRNNPHYHLLFFLEPYKDCFIKFPTPIEFRHLVRLYWQGVDQDEITGVNPRNYKYGIVKEGDNLGLVDRFNASVYCAKYVCKDARLKWFEHFAVGDLIRDNLRLNIQKGVDTPDFVYDDMIEDMVHDSILEFRNRFCNKCRISHGVGEYGLKHITSDYKIPVPDGKKGMKNRTLSLYYYRKLFNDVVKDKVPSTVIDKQGREKLVYNNLYVLNQKGIDYKVSQLENRIKKLADKTEANVSLVLHDSSLFNRMVDSDVNIDVHFDYQYFIDSFNELRKHFSLREDSIFRRFAEYKLVYQDRFFCLDFPRDSVFYLHPRLEPVLDYKRFLSPSFYNFSYCLNGALSFVLVHPQKWISYDSHESFCEFLNLFRVFDLCSDYFFIQKDDKDEKDAEERKRIRQFHVKRKLNEKYGQVFGIS